MHPGAGSGDSGYDLFRHLHQLPGDRHTPHPHIPDHLHNPSCPGSYNPAGPPSTDPTSGITVQLCQQIPTPAPVTFTCPLNSIPVLVGNGNGTASFACQTVSTVTSNPVACSSPYAAQQGYGCLLSCANGATAVAPATCPSTPVPQATPQPVSLSTPQPTPQPAPPVSSVYCTPPLSTTGGASCPFVIQVDSGNDIQRISGRENLPPVGIDLALNGTSLTVTLTNNTVDSLDLSHTHSLETPPQFTPTNCNVSSGTVTAQGRTATQTGFTLDSGATTRLTCTLQPTGGQALPSNPVDVVRSDNITGIDARTGEALAELGGKGMIVKYTAGWNIVGGPTGTLLNLPPDALFTFQAGDTADEVLPTRQALKAGVGYWDSSSQDHTEILRVTDPQTVTVSLPAGQFVLVADPGSTPATVSGADEVLTYDPANGYQKTTTIMPGHGAFAFSSGGALITIVNAPESP